MSEDSAFLDAVRKAALPGIWSQGVGFARDHAVVIENRQADAIVLRVRVPNRPVAPTVVLYPDSEEWSCDCEGKVDPCAHVVGAAIAWSQEKRQGALPSASQTQSKLRYSLSRKGPTLLLERAVLSPDGSAKKLEGSVSNAISRAEFSGLSPSHEDLTIDRIVSAAPRGEFPVHRAADLFAALSSSDEVYLDGKKIRTSAERIFPRASVEDTEQGVRLRIERDPKIDEVIALTIVRVGDVLHPIGEAQLSGDKLEHLPITRHFSRDQFGTVVSSILPELEKKIAVEVRTSRLPRTGHREKPRILFELSQEGHALSVVPLLVYGDPPAARVDGDTLVALGKTLPVRNESGERELKQKLRDDLNLLCGRRVDFDGADAVRFARRLRSWQSEHATDVSSPAGILRGVPLAARLAMDGDSFDVIFETSVPVSAGSSDADASSPDPARAPAEAVIRAWRDGLDLVPIAGGGWGTLPLQWLEQHGERVASLLSARDENKRVARAALLELGALCEQLELPKPLSVRELEPLLTTQIPEAKLSESLGSILRSYQRDGANWLCFLRDARLGAVLADDMGLGKTVQALAAVERGKRTLVVSPKSVVFNWAAEIGRFRPDLRTAIYHGKGRALDPDVDVTLTTYAVVRLDIERLATEGWNTIIIDEAQAIKNPDSQIARAAYQLKADFRLSLSGTPIENRLEELWSQLHFTNPGLLGGRSDFKERYETPIANGNEEALQKLRAKIHPFLLRRRKREVAPELPPRTEGILYCELEDDERAIYDAVRAATKKEVVEKLQSGSGILQALEALLRLRQAACHASLVPGQQRQGSAKLERLLGALEDAAADGHKALVFSQWTSLLDLVEPALRESGISFVRLDGSTRDRGEVVSTFQNNPAVSIMLVSLKAGGTGLNLTAADHVFLLDPWWNPAVEDQAADRAHRIGQDKPVFVYRLVTKDTVEEKILALQERKRHLAEAAIDHASGSSGMAASGSGITREELLALLD